MLILKKTLKYLPLLLILILFSSCSAERKNPYYTKRANTPQSHVNQLGRNKYYFSDSYQKRLNKSYKRK
ncbi:MAG: hypothetical protein Q8868_15465 [Bacteroidota bacterium]|nr:hypothetical protein [Bacteroidota bacterium]